MILHQDAWQCLFQMLLKRDPTPLAWLACARGGSPPPVVLVNNSTFPGSRMSSQEKNADLKIRIFFPLNMCSPTLSKYHAEGNLRGWIPSYNVSVFTKRVSQMLDRWQCPLLKNERKLFNMSDYCLFRNFMWTFAISSCYQIVIYLVHLFSNDRKMRHSQIHHPYNSEQGEPDRLYLCCHKLLRRRDFLLHQFAHQCSL